MGSVEEKDARYKRGQKSLKYRKPAVRDLLTADVSTGNKKETFTARAPKLRQKSPAHELRVETLDWEALTKKIPATNASKKAK